VHAELAASWDRLAAHAARLRGARIETWLQQDSTRVSQMSLRVGALFADFSKQALDDAALRALFDLAAAAELPRAIASLFAGDPINRSEQRAALHTALRASTPTSNVAGPAADAARLADAARTRMRALVAEIHADARITDVVHVGIGGSDLGPRLVCDALAACARACPRVHFLANVDAHALDALLPRLDPAHTLVCLVSKSFGTQETLLNGQALRDWLVAGVGATALSRHLIAVSANTERARAFGVAPERILPMWDWVGGRYSLWSAVGLPIALSLGWDAYETLLDGARAMDEHYATAPLTRNLPVWMALIGVWNRNVLRLPTVAMAPYADALRLLPAYLQQLEMESNGKSVDQEGRALTRGAAPVIWGEVGTNAQHAYFQSLHQGMDTVPVDFIGVIRPAHARTAQHRVLLANMLAQSAALMRGTGADAPHRYCAGNKPSTVYLLDELDPRALGTLLAAFEHKVHAQGALWGINSFDQWGVELGKRLADDVLAAFDGDRASTVDASTAALLAQIRSRS
jgi:glucose-6-phosphate isomerase